MIKDATKLLPYFPEVSLSVWTTVLLLPPGSQNCRNTGIIQIQLERWKNSRPETSDSSTALVLNLVFPQVCDRCKKHLACIKWANLRSSHTLLSNFRYKVELLSLQSIWKFVFYHHWHSDNQILYIFQCWGYFFN